MSERFAHVELGEHQTKRDGERTIVEDSDVFYYSNPRQDAWADEPDAWLFGYWQRAYFSSYRKILDIDPEKNRIQVDCNLAPGAGRRAEMVEGSGYQGINLLSELDVPGEWYLDRGTGLLYFWPPSPIKEAEVVVSMLEAPIIATESVSNIVFRGLTLEAGRQHGVVVKGGENVLLAGCVVRNMGCKGVNVEGGDFRLQGDSPVYGACLFEPLPLEKMGLYEDELRTNWPVDHPSGNYETAKWE